MHSILTLFNSSVHIAQFPQATSTIDGHNFITSSWRVGQCEAKNTIKHVETKTLTQIKQHWLTDVLCKQSEQHR